MNVVVDNLLINYQDTGRKDGKVILFIHGWASDSSYFNGLMRPLGDKYRCLAVDLPGFGRSQVPSTPLDIPDFSDFIAGFCAKLRIRPYAVIGHSNGGAIAMNAIADKKINPRKLVLLASSGIRTGQRFKKTIYKALAKPAKAGLVLLPSRRRNIIKKKLYGKIGSDYMVSEDMKETFKNVVTYDVAADAAKLKIDTLLLYGSNDTSTPPEMGQKLQKLIKGSKMKTIEEAGHFLYQDSPRLVKDSVESFIR